MACPSYTRGKPRRIACRTIGKRWSSSPISASEQPGWELCFLPTRPRRHAIEAYASIALAPKYVDAMEYSRFRARFETRWTRDQNFRAGARARPESFRCSSITFRAAKGRPHGGRYTPRIDRVVARQSQGRARLVPNSATAHGK